MSNIPKLTLNNGFTIPGLAFGTYKATDDSCKNAVKCAIDAGYRHIDTAYFYANEKSVGEAINEKIAEGVITREDVFVTTKLWIGSFHEVEVACKRSLDALNLGYIDLYLIHSPISVACDDETSTTPKKNENGEFTIIDCDHLELWKQMESLVEKGWARSIGVSNFNSKQVERIVKNCKIKPVCNQVEGSPATNQKQLVEFCKGLGVVVTGYSPLGQTPDPEKKIPRALYDNKVQEIGTKYGKSAAQVILRFVCEIGMIPIVKSATPSRINENLNIFDFKLTQEEIDYMCTFQNFEDRVVKFTGFEKAKEYPFNCEFKPTKIFK